MRYDVEHTILISFGRLPTYMHVYDVPSGTPVIQVAAVFSSAVNCQHLSCTFSRVLTP